MKVKSIVNRVLLLVFCLVHFNVMGETSMKITISRVSLDEFNYGSIYGSAGFMITSEKGTTIVTDPYDVVEGVKADIITVSHSHFDHTDANFIDSMKNCKISRYTAEAFTVNDVDVRGIASSHSPTGINHKMPSNVIYCFGVDGLRIAHMGDIGQEDLTKNQLKEIGKLDLLFMPFADGFGMTTDRSLQILNQIKPKIIIPTHLNKEGFSKLLKFFTRSEYQTARWTFDRNYLDNLGDNRIVVFLIPEHGSIIERWKRPWS